MDNHNQQLYRSQSICLDQADMAFTPGVLAFTRVVTSDALGEQLGSSPAATQPRSSARFSTLISISIPPTRKSRSPRLPRSPPPPDPTTSSPSSLTSSAISSVSATPLSGAP